MAVYGLEIRNPENGQAILRITDRITRLLGAFDTGLASGSFTVSLPDGGTVFIAVDTTSGDPYASGSNVVMPAVAVSGNTITWTFDARTSGRISLRVTYGIY